MQSTRTAHSRSRSLKLFKAADPSDRISPVVARLAFAIPALFVILGMDLERGWLYYPYFVTEWMVNYSAGFLRRGILGELFWLSGSALHVSPMTLIEIARLGVAIAFAALLGSLVYKNRYALGWVGAMTILASPYIIFYLWCDEGSLDLLFVFITAAHLAFSKTDFPRYLRTTTALFTLGGIFLALTHEALYLAILPVNILIFAKICPTRRGVRFVQVFGASLLACLAAIVFHGTPTQAQTLYHHWNAIGFNQPYRIGFEQIGLSLPEELRRIWSDFQLPQLAIWALSFLLFSAPVVALGFKQWKQTDSKLRRSSLNWMLPFVAMLPMCVLGSDWDRWFSIAWATAMVVVLSQQTLQNATPSKSWQKLALVATVLVSLCLRPYSPFLPVHRVLAGPAVRTAEYIRGQVPT